MQRSQELLSWTLVHQHASIGVPNDQVEAFRGVGEAMAQG
jgi:hypothetical protein